MIDTSKWNISYIGEKVIKPMYEDSSFPISLAGEIKSAIEKQIPKKPKYKRIDEYSYGTMTAICPECANILCGIFKKKHCDSCGQKLDWSVEE